MYILRTIAAATTAAALLAAMPALAQSETASANVYLHDIDLTSTDGQARLDRRINAAARAVCASGLRGLAARRAEDPCIAAALLDVAPRAERAVALARIGRRMAGAGLTVGG